MKRKNWRRVVVAIGVFVMALLFLNGAVLPSYGADHGVLQEDKGNESREEGSGSLKSPMLVPRNGGKKDIVVTTPDTLFSYGGYHSVILSSDGQITDTEGISKIPLHFHYGNDGNTAFCLGVNLANPDVEVKYQEADLGDAYGDQLEQVSAIVQNSILKFSKDKKENVLPNQWRDFTYEEAQYTAQLAIWKTLIGKSGNEPEMDGKGWFNDAWLFHNIYFPRMVNLPDGKDIKGFYEYLLQTKTVAQPTAEIKSQKPVYDNGFFHIPLTIQTTEASAGTILMFSHLSGEPKLYLSDQTELKMSYDEKTDVWSYTFPGILEDTVTLRLLARENEEKTIQCHVHAKSNAIGSNLVYLIPGASHYQNLIKVEPKEVKTAETVSDMTLPRVTAQIQIKKVEKGTNNPMEGISFHIWSDNGFEQWIKTDGNGIFRLEGLLPGTYQYQEEVVEEYVKNQEIYTFTVLEDGTVSGQVGSEHTSFSVENLRYCDLTVIKQIKKADIVWAHGNPTFLFSISGADLNGMDHTYYGCIQFTDEDVKKEADSEGYVSLSYTFEHIPMGTDYVIQEEKCNRYLLTNVTSTDENVTITKLEDAVYEKEKKNSDFFKVTVNLKEKPTGTMVTFQNEKVRNDDFSHTSFVENNIPLGSI